MTEIGKRIGQLRPSQYGTVWDIISEKSSDNIEHLDTSYLDVPLAGHTDGTYFTEAPGLVRNTDNRQDAECLKLTVFIPISVIVLPR